MMKKRYSIDEVLQQVEVPDDKEIINFGNRFKRKVDFDGDMIKVSSDRLVLFKDKGCKCVTCGIEGVYFQKDFGGNPTPHFNLYAINDEGEPVLMTKDHIHPKSLGGKDCQANYQPMCTHCNKEKGATI